MSFEVIPLSCDTRLIKKRQERQEITKIKGDVLFSEETDLLCFCVKLDLDSFNSFL